MKLKNLNVVKIVDDHDTEKIESLKALGYVELAENGGFTPPESAVNDSEELDKLSYQELKATATGMGIEYAGNISAANLIDLIKGVEKEA